MDKKNIDASRETNAKESPIKELDEKQYQKLLQQVEYEHTVAKKFLDSKRTEWLSRLRLYNNQRRDKKAVGDPIMFTVFQTVLAALYDDHLAVRWDGKEEGDQETAENLNKLSENDSRVMKKPQIDYYWIWDTCFYGAGYLIMTNFDRTKGIQTTIPERVSPANFLHDPSASGVNGDINGNNSARFFGRELDLTELDMKGREAFHDINKVQDSSNNNGLLKELRESVSTAQNTEYDPSKEFQGDNKTYKAIEWFTHFDGKKVVVTISNEFTLINKYRILGDRDEQWPVIHRKLYPSSDDWYGATIPDFTEDKQRARAIVQNLMIQGTKADLFPMWMYDSDRVKNRKDLNFGFNKFIGVQGPVSDQVLRPINKVNPNMQLANYILETLDASSQRATATPEIQQGTVSAQKRTLGELEMVSTRVDARYSLTAKVFGWSEAEFWLQWYKNYKKYFANSIDEKVIRITGAFGPQWRKLTKENIISTIDPDLTIESRTISEQAKMRKRVEFTQLLNLAAQDPRANLRYGLKKLSRLHNLEKDEIDRLFPPTIDERRAEEENTLLSENKIDQVKILPNDDHDVHLEIHSKAADTPAKAAHIRAHEEALVLQRDNPELFPQKQEGQPGTEPGQEKPNMDTNTPQMLLSSLAPRGVQAPQSAPTQ